MYMCICFIYIERETETETEMDYGLKLSEGAGTFSPHLPYSPSHNIHKFQFSLPLRFPVRPKIQKNSLIFNHKITFTSLHHMPFKPFTNKIGTNMQCQAFENQGFFKLGLLLWGWSIAFIPHQSVSQKKNVYIFIFFSHGPSFSWLET